MMSAVRRTVFTNIVHLQLASSVDSLRTYAFFDCQDLPDSGDVAVNDGGDAGGGGGAGRRHAIEPLMSHTLLVTSKT
jgi:hypothetical protein